MGETIRLKVSKIIHETADAMTIRLNQPLFKTIKYNPGQFITVEVSINGQTERRAYSLNSVPELDKVMEVTVKKVANGLVSNYLHQQVKEGDYLTVVPPLGQFVYLINKKAKRNVTLFAAGSGITPLMAILKSILYFEKESRVSLLYANRKASDIIFREQLNELAVKFPARFRLLHVLKEDEENIAAYTGRTTPEIVKELAGISRDTAGYDPLFYMCGPAGFMDMTAGTMKEIGVEDNRIYRESFTAPVQEEIETNISYTFQVVSGKKNKVTSVTVKPNTTMLTAMLKQGLFLPYSCSTGICGTCKCKLLEGEVSMGFHLGLSEEDKKNGYILPCISRPKSGNVRLHI